MIYSLNLIIPSCSINKIKCIFFLGVYEYMLCRWSRLQFWWHRKCFIHTKSSNFLKMMPAKSCTIILRQENNIALLNFNEISSPFYVLYQCNNSTSWKITAHCQVLQYFSRIVRFSRERSRKRLIRDINKIRNIN